MKRQQILAFQPETKSNPEGELLTLLRLRVRAPQSQLFMAWDFMACLLPETVGHRPGLRQLIEGSHPSRYDRGHSRDDLDYLSITGHHQ